MIFFFNIIFLCLSCCVVFRKKHIREKNICLHYFDYLKRPHWFFGFLTIWVWLVRSVYFQLKNWNFWAWLKNKIIQIHQAKLCSPFSKHKIVKQNPMSAMYSKGLNCIPGSLYFEESNAFNLLLLTWPYKLWNISAGSKTH